jgi:hypothetical protein
MSNSTRQQLSKQLRLYLALEGILAGWLESKLITMTEYNSAADEIYPLIDDDRIEQLERELDR